MTTAVADRLHRALRSLEGLSVGDAFGERFFTNPALVDELIAHRVVPPGTWPWTDDTAMALSVVETLAHLGELDEKHLAERFARRYLAEPHRGYGGGAHRLLSALNEGAGWRATAAGLFGGEGSFGNGGAMRAAPVGAWFAGEPDVAAAAADRSAVVTHAHREGRAGAIAVAVAASVVAAHDGDASDDEVGRAVFAAVLARTPEGETAAGIARASSLTLERPPEEAARILGSGGEVSAMDTVPFCLWCVARHPRDYVEALWATVAGLGDRDTTCAIVGGIVALSSASSIPEAWLGQREALPRLDVPPPRDG